MGEAGAPRDVAALAKATSYEGSIAFEIREQSTERVRSVMPVTDGMRNPFGTVHAGALLWFADVTATVRDSKERTLVDVTTTHMPA